MRWLVGAVVGVAIAAAAHAESFTVAHGETLTLQRPGVTAAYSLDSNVAEASAAAGAVTIRGVGEGKTLVVVVFPESTSSLTVTVLASPVVLPPGFVAMPVSRSGQSGFVEARYASDPRQLAAALELRRDERDRTEELRILGSSYWDTGLGRRFGLPQFTYRIAAADRELALGDALLMNSPLTVYGTQVRGLHLRNRLWSLHAGFGSLVSYEGAIFSSAPDRVLGVTRSFHLDEETRIDGNFYWFEQKRNQVRGTAEGPLASVVFNRERPGLKIISEVALGRHAAGAAAIATYEDSRQHFVADLRYRPRDLPSLSIESQQGTFANIDYAAALAPRLNFAGNFIGTSYDLGFVRQRNLSGSERFIYTLNPRWVVSAGLAASSFDLQSATHTEARTLRLPVGATYTRRGLDLSGEYSPAFDMQGRVGSAYRFSAGTALGRVRMSGYYRHDVDLPTLQTYLSTVPGLQDLLIRSGLYITDVNQLIGYLRDTAFLVRLGFASGAGLNVAPARDDVGLNFDWLGRGQRLNLAFFDSNVQLIAGTTRLRTASLTYALQVASMADILLSGSLVEMETNGARSTQPLMTVSYRHRLTSVPRLTVRRNGIISGRVFLDENLAGAYGVGSTGLAGVTVQLDGDRTTKTAADGFYEFADVSPRAHTIGVLFTSDRPFSFTSDSPRQVEINSTADFGVTFLLGKVFGRVANDAGRGIAGVSVKLSGRNGSRMATSDDSGFFAFDNLADGPYWISTVADSYPAGFDVTTLSGFPLLVQAGSPAPFEFFARALRSISGTVTALDPRSGKPVPLAGVEVKLAPLGLTARTVASGRYRFFDLPAGTYTVQCDVGGRHYSSEVELPAGPFAATGVDFTALGDR